MYIKKRSPQFLEDFLWSAWDCLHFHLYVAKCCVLFVLMRSQVLWAFAKIRTFLQPSAFLSVRFRFFCFWTVYVGAMSEQMSVQILLILLSYSLGYQNDKIFIKKFGYLIFITHICIAIFIHGEKVSSFIYTYLKKIVGWSLLTIFFCVLSLGGVY